MTSLPESQCHFDPSLQTENIAFAEAELIACQGCGRKNAPDRAACIYCGRDLENPRATKLSFRKIEAWERGFSVVARRLPEDRTSMNAVAALLDIEIERLREIAGSQHTLPLMRVESLAIAESIIRRIANHGGECLVLADTDLNIEKPPARLKRIELDGSEIVFVDFNGDNVYRLRPDDLSLIVTGRLITSRTDSLEKKRRGGKTALLDESSTASDEAVADIYTSDAPNGFRIRLSGFDFSCLGSERQLLAAENFGLLIERLSAIAPDAIVADYMPSRRFLDEVWEIETHKDAQGLKRAGFARKEFGSVATTSNISQFTRFSRMHWHLLKST